MLHSLLLYDLKAYIPVSATITAAVWWIYVPLTNATGNHIFKIKRLTRTDWTEDEATWGSYKGICDGGTAEAGGSNYLDDLGKSWATDEWAGDYVVITGGTGAGQMRAVSGNTADRLTVSSNWTTNPDDTSRYVVGEYLWTASGGDYTETGAITLGIITTTGWKNFTVTSMVTDAWSNRNGICTFVCLRDDAYMAVEGFIWVQNKTDSPTYKVRVHHLRITYTLDGQTFQVMIW